MNRIQEKMAEKGRTSRVSELNGRSLQSVDQSRNLLSSTVQVCRTFKICFTFLSLIVLEI